MSPDDRGVRIIVGSKGAGKTLYLRRLQDAASREPSLYADDWQIDLPRTTEILRVTEWDPDVESTTTERWQEIWKAATLRSLVSHVLSDKERRLLQARRLHGQALRSRYPMLFPRYDEPATVYNELRDIINRHSRKEELDGYLAQREWGSLERLLSEALRDCPPVCFYIDALDHRFESAPQPWLWCQLGLFDTVMAFLNDPRLGSRLHLVIGVRDIVYSAKQSTEHAMKLQEGRPIRLLDWDNDAISHFLDQKLRTLPDEYLLGGDDTTGVERWLGMATIYNEVRREHEPISSYLIRHSRLIPRDIVTLGNQLCRLIDRVRDHGQTFLADEDVRASVRLAARSFGNEQLMIVANHLTATSMPYDAARYGIDDIYTSEHGVEVEHGRAFQEAVRDQLSDLLRTLRRDRFSRSRMEEFEEDGRRKFEYARDLPSILWQHGLLGYVDGTSVLTGPTMFYAASHEDHLRLPRHKVGYCLHPILVDTIDGLSGVGAPVRPY